MRSMTLRGQRASNPEALICQLCQSTASPAVRYRPQTTRSFASTTPVTRGPRVKQCLSNKTLKSLSTTPLSPRRYASTASEAPVLDPSTTLREIERTSANLRKSQTVPSNQAVIQTLQKALAVAESIAQPKRTADRDEDAISSLLSLEEKKNLKQTSKPTKHANLQAPSVETLSRLIHTLLTDEKIFISPEVLELYVKIHTLLKRPDHFPQIFHLYANKPIPEENSSPVKYLKPAPKSINSAIPVELADMALNTAIEQRNLGLVLSIIDNTFCTPAFHRAKFFKKAAAPLGALSLTPAGCYIAASWAASFQNTMEPATATAIAFAATLAYVGGTSSVGILAIVTANDHMDRVVWAPGVPLRHRWLREEERAALDRVAVAWGFKDVYMRGEEEGEEWESLREFIGMRGMILDKTDLMQGME
ncbi:hypothetical protein BJY04DRAFT_177727 [Aspergillus karnatakaensis]|uniref:uncharacterized protein n=1 Tax=Aspergillus karnatakaensis TaxID=1810916 RepID=UPI003CCE31C5